MAVWALALCWAVVPAAETDAALAALALETVMPAWGVLGCSSSTESEGLPAPLPERPTELREQNLDCHPGAGDGRAARRAMSRDAR